MVRKYLRWLVRFVVFGFALYGAGHLIYLAVLWAPVYAPTAPEKADRVVELNVLVPSGEAQGEILNSVFRSRSSATLEIYPADNYQPVLKVQQESGATEVISYVIKGVTVRFVRGHAPEPKSDGIKPGTIAAR